VADDSTVELGDERDGQRSGAPQPEDDERLRAIRVRASLEGGGGDGRDRVGVERRFVSNDRVRACDGYTPSMYRVR
jgi:hypothetical protein